MSEMSNEIYITIEQAINIPVATYLAGERMPIYYQGQPGVGKTSVAHAAAEKLRATYPDFKVHILAPSTMPAEDIGGIPWPSNDEEGNKVAEYLLPVWWPTDPEERGFLVLDDLGQAAPDVQKIAANIILERSLRGHKLPEGYQIMASGNNLTDRAGATRLFGHLWNRMTKFNVVTSVEDWSKWAMNNGIRNEIVGWVNMDKAQLCDYDPQRDQNPTPRMWARVSKWMDVMDSSPSIKSTALAAFAGCIGSGPATEFYGFLELFGKLPDIKDVLDNAGTHQTNYELNVKYALVVSLASHANQKNLGSVLTYTERLGTEFSWLTIQMASARDKSVMDCPAFTKWAIKNQELIHSQI